MKRSILASIGVGMLIVGLIVVYGIGFTVEAQQQPPPPTPKGQLGGAPRLTPLIGGEATVTPVPPAGTPSAENGSACAVAPRSLAEIEQLSQATPTANTNVAIVAEPGAPADAGTVAAVTGTVAGFVTCLNEGDQLRALASMTDDAVRQSIAAVGWDRAALAVHLQGLPPRADDQQLLVRSVSEVTRLPDGRVVATVELVDQARFPLATTRQQWLFVQGPTDGRWLIAAIAPA